MDYGDMVAPRFILRSNTPGVDLSDIIADIASMTYEDASRGMDKCTFTLLNTDLKYANDDRFRTGIQFWMRWGYPREFSHERLMVVKGAAQGFEAGFPLIQLTAYDIGRTMAVGTRATNWGAVSSSEIAEKVALQYGFLYNIEESPDRRRQHRVQPANVSTYEYLLQLAERIGYDFYMEGNTLHFHRPDTGAPPSFRFVYYRDGGSVLRSFVPNVNDARPPATAHANTNRAGTAGSAQQTGTHASDPRTSPATARYREQINSDGTHSRVAIPPQPVTHATPETNERVRQAHARAQQSQVEMRAHTASASFIGLPRLRARQIITIDVVEQRYSGQWRVEETQHTIDATGGYVTTARLTKSGLNRGRHANRTPTSQQNQHPTVVTERADVLGSERQLSHVVRQRTTPATNNGTAG